MRLSRPLFRTCLCLVVGWASAALAPAATPSETYLLRGAAVAEARERIRAGDPTVAEAKAQLTAQAERWLTAPIETIIEKPQPAPSGDLRDYVSLSPYWWPNPDTSDGLPYVRRDGEVNPERDLYDLPRLDRFTKAVNWLAWGYYFTGDERYADRAAQWLRAWFIDAETRMNPRVQYGQFVPGVSEGRNFGVIETNRFRWFPDAVAMLDGAAAMTSDLDDGVREWFDAYLTWLLTSELGRAEQAEPNNHGTWATAQVALYARFVGREDVVRQAVEEGRRRIGTQIEPDGRQPHELARTRPLHYSAFNLRGLMDLARHGEALGIDLWGYRTEDGRSIRAAVDFLLPYMTGAEPFPYDGLPADRRDDTLAEALRMAANGFREPAYDTAIQRLELPENHVVWLELLMPAIGDSH